MVRGGGLRRSRREALGTPIIGTPLGTNASRCRRRASRVVTRASSAAAASLASTSSARAAAAAAKAPFAVSRRRSRSAAADSIADFTAVRVAACTSARTSTGGWKTFDAPAGQAVAAAAKDGNVGGGGGGGYPGGGYPGGGRGGGGGGGARVLIDTLSAPLSAPSPRSHASGSGGRSPRSSSHSSRDAFLRRFGRSSSSNPPGFFESAKAAPGGEPSAARGWSPSSEDEEDAACSAAEMAPVGVSVPSEAHESVSSRRRAGEDARACDAHGTASGRRRASGPSASARSAEVRAGAGGATMRGRGRRSPPPRDFASATSVAAVTTAGPRGTSPVVAGPEGAAASGTSPRNPRLAGMKTPRAPADFFTASSRRMACFARRCSWSVARGSGSTARGIGRARARVRVPPEARCEPRPHARVRFSTVHDSRAEVRV